MKKEASCKRASFFSDLPLSISGFLPENSISLFPTFYGFLSPPGQGSNLGQILMAVLYNSR